MRDREHMVEDGRCGLTFCPSRLAMFRVAQKRRHACPHFEDRGVLCSIKFSPQVHTSLQEIISPGTSTPPHWQADKRCLPTSRCLINFSPTSQFLQEAFLKHFASDNSHSKPARESCPLTRLVRRHSYYGGHRGAIPEHNRTKGTCTTDSRLLNQRK